MINFFKSFQSKIFAASTSRDGGVSKGTYASMNLCDYVGDEPETVTENRRIFCKQIGITTEQLIFPRQTHSDHIFTINTEFLSQPAIIQKKSIEDTDALITNIPQICIGISTADCVPILLYDSNHQVIATVHAGWRGTVSKICLKAIHQMEQSYTTDPCNIFAAIGPCISQTNYEVGEELLEAFKNANFPTDKLFVHHPVTNKYHLNLREANRLLLIEAGIPPAQIEISDICTFAHSDLYFSARKSGIQSGRIASCLMLK